MSSPDEPDREKEDGTSGEDMLAGAAKDDVDSSAPEIVSRILGGGGDQEKVIREMFGLVMGPTANPLSRKITEQHIDKVLDNERLSREKSHSLRMWKLVFDAFVLLVVLAFVSFLAYVFRDRDQVVVPLITGLIAFLAGAAGGFGLAKSGRYTD